MVIRFMLPPPARCRTLLPDPGTPLKIPKVPLEEQQAIAVRPLFPRGHGLHQATTETPILSSYPLCPLPAHASPEPRNTVKNASFTGRTASDRYLSPIPARTRPAPSCNRNPKIFIYLVIPSLPCPHTLLPNSGMP